MDNDQRFRNTNQTVEGSTRISAEESENERARVEVKRAKLLKWKKEREERRATQGGQTALATTEPNEDN